MCFSSIVTRTESKQLHDYKMYSSFSDGNVSSCAMCVTRPFYATVSKRGSSLKRPLNCLVKLFHFAVAMLTKCDPFFIFVSFFSLPLLFWIYFNCLFCYLILVPFPFFWTICTRKLKTSHEIQYQANYFQFEQFSLVIQYF